MKRKEIAAKQDNEELKPQGTPNSWKNPTSGLQLERRYRPPSACKNGTPKHHRSRIAADHLHPPSPSFRLVWSQGFGGSLKTLSATDARNSKMELRARL